MAVLATLLILAGIYVLDYFAPVTENGGLSKKQVDTAIDIALHDSSFSYDPSQDKYWIGNVTPTTFGEYGLINASGIFADVPIQLREQAPMRQDFIFTVDVNDKKVIVEKMIYSESLMGRYFKVNIPPGGYFYRLYWTSRFLFHNELDKPIIADNDISVGASGPVEPMFVNNLNFEKLKKGAAFDVIRYVDYPKNSTYVSGGPMGKKWSAYLRARNESFYLILKNLDYKNATTVTIGERPLPPPPESF